MQPPLKQTVKPHPKNPQPNTNRNAREEAAYATPVPQEHRGPISAEENMQRWGTRRTLPINRIRTVAAELRRNSNQHPQSQH